MKDSSLYVCVVSDENWDSGSVSVGRCCRVSASVLCDKVWSQHSCWLDDLTLSSLLINSSDSRTAATGRAPRPSPRPPSSCRRWRWRRKRITDRHADAQTDQVKKESEAIEWPRDPGHLCRHLYCRTENAHFSPEAGEAQVYLPSRHRSSQMWVFKWKEGDKETFEAHVERRKAKIRSNLLMKRLHFSFHCFIHDMYLTPIRVIWSCLLGVVLLRPSL